ncbi:isoleucine--tRNA ligase [Lacibacterium aquatile]|uniref:Isoleucine--tRNA ligase n=1 Tax=Lacibacterium aquatile TaxID=1168082 RepID=A0ABW5DW71_9PROT
MSRDYKDSVFLPQTDFPMRAGLPVAEPKILERWEKIDLYRLNRQDGKGREKFVLHDGPPYANGDIHIGHAVNKILKDVIVKAQRMLGKDAAYVPGWDCHGLPIEWKIEEQYRAKGKDKNAVPPVEFRQECRAFAEGWIDIQRTQFKRLGVTGDWADPYKTMNFGSEAQIFRELTKFLMSGSLYQGFRPVLWSVVEQTALADAEVEYHDHTSTQIHVRFKVQGGVFDGASALIWTTTPWTMPGNRAICYNPELAYVVLEVGAVEDGSLAQVGEKLIVAEALVEAVAKAAKISAHTITSSFAGAALEGVIAAHPLRGQGYDYDVPLLPGDHVTADAGTGLVHTAPGHGEDDFDIGQKFNLELPRTVAGDGTYYPSVPLFAGMHVYKVADAMCETLDKAGGLLAKSKLVHSYPHSWRSKAPLIYRATPQWFISMEHGDLRKKALQAIADTRWVPEAGENRIRSMIESRPDWCVSRQRSWGTPLAIFVNKATGEPLRDDTVNDRIAEAFEAEGGDAWFSSPPERFLGNQYKAEDFEQIMDVVEVWFDSGSTHSFVLEKREDQHWPADLYLEGSDQHRGWFHTSLLESAGTRGVAPYKAVLTHGFALDEQGRKMSKSLGNVVSPLKVADEYGIDILRLWVVSSDYSEDVRIGPEILKYQADHYRRLRNTLRYLLGAVQGFDVKSEKLPFDEMPELERWVLAELVELDSLVRNSIQAYDFHGLYSAIHNFCANELSAFYFDIRKDSLYCDDPAEPRRRAARTVMAILLDCLTKWLAPVLSFTAEEAWGYAPGATGDETDSVHRQLFPEIPDEWRDGDLLAKWEVIRGARRRVTSRLEVARSAKEIGSSTQAAPMVYASRAVFDILETVNFAEVCITSNVGLVPLEALSQEKVAVLSAENEGSGDFHAVLENSSGEMVTVSGADVLVEFAKTEYARCERCRNHYKEVGTIARNPDLCFRCDAVIGG